MYLKGGVGSTRACIASYKNFSLSETMGIVNQMRTAEMAKGEPKRKLKPLSRYLLDHLLHKYLEEDAPRGRMLEMIVIEAKE